MYCPTCSLEHTEARRFCNRCGTNLEMVFRALSGNMPDPATDEKLEQRQKAMRRALIVFGIGPIFSLGLLIVAEILRAVLPPVMDLRWGFPTDPPEVQIIQNLALFGPLLMLLGVMMMTYVRVIYGRKKDLIAPSSPPQPVPEKLTQPIYQPPQSFVTPLTAPPEARHLTPPSVTENTTFRLKAGEPLATDADARQTQEELLKRRQPMKEHP